MGEWGRGGKKNELERRKRKKYLSFFLFLSSHSLLKKIRPLQTTELALFKYFGRGRPKRTVSTLRGAFKNQNAELFLGETKKNKDSLLTIALSSASLLPPPALPTSVPRFPSTQIPEVSALRFLCTGLVEDAHYTRRERKGAAFPCPFFRLFRRLRDDEKSDTDASFVQRCVAPSFAGSLSLSLARDDLEDILLAITGGRGFRYPRGRCFSSREEEAMVSKRRKPMTAKTISSFALSHRSPSPLSPSPTSHQQLSTDQSRIHSAMNDKRRGSGEVSLKREKEEKERRSRRRRESFGFFSLRSLRSGSFKTALRQLLPSSFLLNLFSCSTSSSSFFLFSFIHSSTTAQQQHPPSKTTTNKPSLPLLLPLPPLQPGASASTRARSAPRSPTPRPASALPSTPPSRPASLKQRCRTTADSSPRPRRCGSTKSRAGSKGASTRARRRWRATSRRSRRPPALITTPRGAGPAGPPRL